MNTIPLEDNFTDVVGKAQRGLGVNDADLAKRAGISVGDLGRFKEGNFDGGLARKIAPVLNLGADTLAELGQKSWYPQPVELEGLASFNTAYEDMTVNSFLIFDSQSKKAAVFDTGSTCAPMIDYAKEKGLEIELILLTHTHVDHVADLEQLENLTDAPVYVGEKEQFRGGQPFEAGKKFTVGKLNIESRQTSGHAKGGITFVVTGLARRIAVVGDALFAASMGGGAISFEEALRTNRKEIFSLPDDTIICPGHGPMTTVGEQKKHNPFYPEFQK